jgi:NAD(P)H-hydrate epimerase
MNELGIPGVVLMEHAGRAVADVVARFTTKSALVIAGPGNNGGDGWVVARHLWGRSIPCPVVTLVAPAALTGDAALSARIFLRTAAARGWDCEQLGGEAGSERAPFRHVDLASDLEHLLQTVDPDVVVDALFGTGLRRTLEGVALHIVKALARFGGPIVSIDIPSGLPTDGQAPRGPCVRAAATVTFQQKKIAHASEPGRAHCGDVHVVDIGIMEPPLRNDALSAGAHRLLDARALLPAVDVDAHKGRFGHVAVVAGEFTGAARLASRAALRAGAGLVTILARSRDALGGAALTGVDAEIMVRALDGELEGAPEEASRNIGALVVGPGLGADRIDVARRLLAEAARTRVPCVVDAEAVEALAQRPIQGLRGHVTPHPGEAGRALGVSSADIQQDRLAAVRALKQRFGPGVVVVLKGSSPLILGDAADDGAADGAAGAGPIVVEGGAPALAVAGSGDVLAGAIGGLLARGMSPLDAALAGVEAHQRAGRALAALGARGHLASEIADAIRGALLPGA